MPKQLYRLYLHSNDRLAIGGNTVVDANFLCRIPAVVKKGYVYLESMYIVGTNGQAPFGAGLHELRVRSNSLSHYNAYETSNVSSNLLFSIPNKDEYTANTGDDFRFKATVTGHDVGFPVQNLNLDNWQLNIQLEDDTFTAMTNVTTWGMNLVFIDEDEE